MRSRLLVCLSALPLLACTAPAPLGDGTFEGELLAGWHDVALGPERIDEGIVLLIHDDTVPLPREIVVRRIQDPGALVFADWSSITEVTVPAPRTRVGDEWQDNTRVVHRFRKRFPGGAAFEADVQVQVGEAAGLEFLQGLTLAER